MRVALVQILAVMALAVTTLVTAESSETSLKEKITQSLESLLAVNSQVQGIENCENKCDKAFNRFAYTIAVLGDQRTNEFRACVRGCEQCTTDLTNTNATPGGCFRFCKNFDWTSEGITKGVIEPDKACIGGCIIQTCQAVCSGGTVEPRQTAQNRHLFWRNGGCSIKTEPYSQNQNYVPWDSPNTGQGGNEDVASCCANALSLCQYVGPTTSANYQQLLQNTLRICRPFANANNAQEVCAYFNTPRNCGTLP